MGNLRSVERAIQHLGHTCEVATDLQGTTRLIIPGVGAFGAAMERLAPLKEEIVAFARGGNPVLGICLGQQLLFERSEEMGEHEGLGLLGGSVRYLPSGMGLKVPHVGWNRLRFSQPHGLGEGAGPDDQVYFVHSLHTVCDDPADAAAITEYGIPFVSAVQRENVWGVQFHPEKSSTVGLRILSRFLS